MRSTLSKAAALVIAALFASSVAPSVAAESLESPTDFTATPEGDGVVLTWNPPEGEDPDGYRVYLDGTLAATLVEASVWVPAAASYAVTAVYDADTGETESRAAVIFGPQVSAGCTSTTINGTPPFVHPGVMWQCMDPVWRLIEDLLGFSPSSITLQVDI